MKTIGPHDELVQILAEAIRRLGAKKLSKSPLTPLAVPPNLRLHVNKREEDK